ncbi:MAG: cobalamin-binding protein [Gammaproteobacteria bacterium]|nr:cobalamin-binding protein [Gammaproteobacteria bacterium]
MTRFVALVATLAIPFALVTACDQANQTAPETETVRRVVTLAPHLTELVFAAGAGDTLVGVSAYSDYPPEATSIAVVSDAFTVDQEQLVLLSPDIVLAWQSGTPAHVIDELRNGGYRVESIRTRDIDDISISIRRIGELTGHRQQAAQVAEDFEKGIVELRDEYAEQPSISVFYQISLKPLYTINGEHYIGEILELCGGHNIFADMNELAPSVTVEAVVDRNPEALFAGSADGASAFSEWQRWPHLKANQFGNHFTVNSDEIGRPSTRLISAATSICGHLETARQNRHTTTE